MRWLKALHHRLLACSASRVRAPHVPHRQKAMQSNAHGDTPAAAADAPPVGEQQLEREQQPRRRPARRPQPPRPTHFLSLQLSHVPAVVAAVEAVKAGLLAHSPALCPACVDAKTAHLTLGVLALRSPEELEAAAAALAQLGAALEQEGLLRPLRVTLEGLSTFQNKVLYLDVRRDEGCDQLYRLAAAARTAYQEAGLPLQGGREFTPHLTVAKMSKLLEAAGADRGQRPWGRGRGRGGRGGRWRKDGNAEPATGSAPAGKEREGEGGKLVANCRAEEDAGAAMSADPNTSAAAAVAAINPGSSIPPEAWAAQAGVSGGSALVAEVQLCSMKGRPPGGYYAVAASLALG